MAPSQHQTAMAAKKPTPEVAAVVGTYHLDGGNALSYEISSVHYASRKISRISSILYQ